MAKASLAFGALGLSGTADAAPFSLKPAQSSVPLVLDKGPQTQAWSYNNTVPGPLLRYSQGERLRVEVQNDLPDATTVHWHGLRLPASMDGVPRLSQPPIEPGESFIYDFELPDAGTYWYHPHFNSSEQVGRGLYGVLIVDEPEPIAVDRDIVWVMDDWRLDQSAQILPFAMNMHDASHGGRIGNSVTVNGSIEEKFEVYSGERLRLRLLNAANARIFALRFERLQPWLIALDGQPVEPMPLVDNRIVLGPGQRADLIVDMTGMTGDVETVVDDAYGTEYAYSLMRLIYREGRGGLLSSEGKPHALEPNPVAEPDIANARRHRLVFEGGAMGGMRGAMLNGKFQDMRALATAGKLWAINGSIVNDIHQDPPILALSLGESYVLELENRTAFPHPIHLHGHLFRVLSRDGIPDPIQPMRDTVLVAPQQVVEIAFVADNPGYWMFHCHILEHQATAMMGVVHVA